MIGFVFCNRILFDSEPISKRLLRKVKSLAQFFYAFIQWYHRLSKNRISPDCSFVNKKFFYQ